MVTAINLWKFNNAAWLQSADYRFKPAIIDFAR